MEYFNFLDLGVLTC